MQDQNGYSIGNHAAALTNAGQSATSNAFVAPVTLMHHLLVELMITH